jgi:transposase
LVKSSPERTVALIAWELGVDHGMLRQWVEAVDKWQAWEAAGLGRVEFEGFRWLCKENAELKLEKEILRKAVWCFAKEVG